MKNNPFQPSSPFSSQDKLPCLSFGANTDHWDSETDKWKCASLQWNDTPAVAFDPTSLPSFSFWLKADSGTFTTSALSVPATTDGTRVGGWTPASGSVGSWLQTTSGLRPTLKTNIQNGLPVIRFGAENGYYLLNTPISAIGDLSILFAFNATADANTQGLIFSDSGSNASIANFAGTVAVPFIIFSPGGNNHSQNYGWEPNVFTIYEIHRSGTSISFFRDGVDMSTGTGGNTAFVFGEISGRNGGNFPCIGDIGEVLFYTAALSTENRVNCMRYLRARWGTR